MDSVFTVAMVTKMAAKIGCKWESDHFGANLIHLTEKLTWSTSKYQKDILTDGENYHGTRYIKSCFCIRLC